MTDEETILDLRHVNVARGGKTVLHDLSLAVRRGEHLAILGPNGCGKSTLIKTLTCECYPLAEPGMHVRLFGRERWDLTQLRRMLGVVSADLPGKPMLGTNGRDAVLTGFFSSSTLWPNLTVTAEMEARADEVLEVVGGVGLARKPVGEMSAGQQRRIMIGRALVGSAGTLLLDEPSNALDLAAQRELQRVLRELAGRGTTILLITHHLPDILPEIERVLLMREGRIVGDGAKGEMLTSGRLSELFGVGVGVVELDRYYFAS
jgi:iron complex transport system ATP-binding protein